MRLVTNALATPLALLTLAICLFYTYAGGFLVPYSGLSFSNDWVIDDSPQCPASIEWCRSNRDLIQVGDRLIQIDELSFEEYKANGASIPFANHVEGDTVPIILERGNLQVTVWWKIPPPALQTRLAFFANILVYIPFWIVGTVILFLLQPHDERWHLSILLNYVTAVWLAVGLVSGTHAAFASPLMHALSWLLVPIYIHFHLRVPSAYWQRASLFFLPALYTGAFLAALFELAQLMPREAFSLPLLFGITVSLALITWRLLTGKSSADRVALRLMGLGVMLAFTPGLLVFVLPSLAGWPSLGSLPTSITILALPVLPFFYLYAINKHRLGNFEFSANRLLGLYSFLLIYATLFVFFVTLEGVWDFLPSRTPGFSLALAVALMAIAIPLRPYYQRLIERMAYGIGYDPEKVLTLLTNRMPSALDREALVALLTREVTPRLLIRQSALYLLRDSRPTLFYEDGVSLERHPRSLRALDDVLAHAGQYRPREQARRGEFEWVRVAIVLKLGNQRIGVWLLGRRDPEDFYGRRDIELLKTLANQMTPVLENIRLFEETGTAAHQFSLLYDAGLALNSVLKPRAQLEYLSELAMKTLHADRAAFFLFDSAHNDLLLEFGIGFEQSVRETLETRRLPMGDKGGLVGWVAKNRLPINVPDVRSNPLCINLDPGIRSGLWSPVERKKELRGVMTVYSTRVNAFTEQDERLLVLFANQAAVALENARLFEAEKTRREELAGLYDLSRALAAAAFDFDAILDLIARRAVETLHSTFVRVLLLEGNEFVIRAEHPARLSNGDNGIGKREPAAAHRLLFKVLQENQVTLVNANSPSLSAYECTSLFRGIAQSACVVPLVVGERGMGLIVIGQAGRRDREAFAREKLPLARSIGDLTINALHQAELYGELEQSYLQTVLTLAQAVDAKDTYTADHGQRLAEMALAVGRQLRMSARELEDLRYGAILHDIGKIGVHDSVLQKPGKLNEEERALMRQHPVIGARILSPVPRLSSAALIIRHHHEHFDGRGYPDGLSGEAIPLGARILAIVDAYGAITDARVYKKARSHAEAIAELHAQAGTQFDPPLVELFIRTIEHRA